MAIDPKYLPDDPKILQQMILDLMAQLDRESSERQKIEALLRELLDAKRKRKSEQLSADQLALFAELLQARQAQTAESEKGDGSDDESGGGGTGEAAPKKRTGGRQPLPKSLLRERIVHDLAEEEKHCTTCQKDLRPIGEETSERYEYIPASMKVVQDVCLKYACDCTVKTAGKPPQPIEKSTAGASLLAQVIVAKWADHQPPGCPLGRAGEDVRAAGHRHLAQDHGRVDGAMCGTAGSFVPADEEGAARFQGDRHRRYQREGAGSQASFRQDWADLALCRRRASSGDRVRLYAYPIPRRAGEVPGRIPRISAGGRRLRL